MKTLSHFGNKLIIALYAHEATVNLILHLTEVSLQNMM